MNFPCTGCGACCRALPAASALNRGDGVCRHHDAVTQRCTIYAERPLICRVDDLYRERLAGQVTRRVYYLLQAQACVALDASNSGMPLEMARQLVMEEGTALSPVDPDSDLEAMASLPPEEAAQGLEQVMTAVQPLL
ncbi:YkgJ family cysteine cluster protein [Roseateles sp. SL47]|uniref:YkgJ family cysteine cluster protein n=1 Tax=Roseateles sp. SL47 TaxID=2995138 RepID=UPI002271F85F|nr:YkgJ family cysteine cluster protein [Roseateles sp. SL47]WAC74594.1 YkgJ family cysteine cluster protein [Roseateles sp. SL47]